MDKVKRDLLRLTDQQLREALSILLEKYPQEISVLDRFKVSKSDPVKSLKQWMSDHSDKFNNFENHLLFELNGKISYVATFIHDAIHREPKAAFEMFVETVEILDSYTIHYSYIAQMILDQLWICSLTWSMSYRI